MCGSRNDDHESGDVSTTSSSATTTNITTTSAKFVVTLGNVQTMTTYDLRQELERRDLYDPKKDGEATYKNFLRIMVSILEKERLEREREDMIAKEKERRAQFEAEKREREERKRETAGRIRAKRESAAAAVASKGTKIGACGPPANVRSTHIGTDALSSLRLPKRF